MSAGAIPSSAAELSDGPVTHIVMFQFKPEATQAEIDAITHAFSLLPQTCLHPHTHRPYITAPLHWGTNNSPEPFSEGLTHIFVMTFPGGVQDRNYYVNDDPVHAEFKKILGVVARPVVVDFIGREGRRGCGCGCCKCCGKKEVEEEEGEVL